MFQRSFCCHLVDILLFLKKEEDVKFDFRKGFVNSLTCEGGDSSAVTVISAAKARSTSIQCTLDGMDSVNLTNMALLRGADYLVSDEQGRYRGFYTLALDPLFP